MLPPGTKCAWNCSSKPVAWLTLLKIWQSFEKRENIWSLQHIYLMQCALNIVQSNPTGCRTGNGETKQKPSRARAGHQISCCLVYLRFLCDIPVVYKTLNGLPLHLLTIFQWLSHLCLGVGQMLFCPSLREINLAKCIPSPTVQRPTNILALLCMCFKEL